MAVDVAGFTTFVREHQRGLLRLATALTANPVHAEDIVAEVLARAFEKWDRISRTERTAAYVSKMVVNEFLTRKRRSRWIHPYADLTKLPGAARAPDPASVLSERAALIGELAKLPARQRAALVLRYYEGLPDDEIAATLDCATGTVRSLVSRALSTLRIEMATDGRLLFHGEA